MHYEDGTEVQLGDVCIHKSAGYSPTASLETMGVVASGNSNADSCNLQVVVLAQRNISDLGNSGWRQSAQQYVTCVTAKECRKVKVEKDS